MGWWPGQGGVCEECLDTKAFSLRWVGFHTQKYPQCPEKKAFEGPCHDVTTGAIGLERGENKKTGGTK